MARPALDVARDLARAHRAADGHTRLIKWFPSNGSTEIRLLEVSDSAPTSGDVIPFRFRANPADGIDFPSTVVLLSPDEWQWVQRGELKLPDGWALVDAQDLPE